MEYSFVLVRYAPDIPLLHNRFRFNTSKINI